MTHPHEYNWVLGHYDQITFPNGGDPVPAPNCRMTSVFGASAISDAQENLVMYSDGNHVWDGSLSANSRIATGIGGDTESKQSCIIVPPAGPNGTDYHVFAHRCDWSELVGTVFGEGPEFAHPLFHSTYRLMSGVLTQIIAPTPLTNQITAGFNTTGKLTAVAHQDCDKYWVIVQSNTSNDHYALLVANDSTPTTVVTSPSNLAQNQNWEFGALKGSPDGSLLAYTDAGSNFTAVLAFDNATGMITDKHLVTGTVAPFGLEFSPDSRTLYMTEMSNSDIRAHTISTGPQNVSACPAILTGYDITAMQLGPNGKIYCHDNTIDQLIEIGQPNSPLNPAVVMPARYADGSDIQLSTQPTQIPHWGALPQFTRLHDGCRTNSDTCETLANNVDDQISDATKSHENLMKSCDGSDIWDQPCKPLEIPEVQPEVSISWGASICDGIESDDFEVMSMTICNPFSNIIFQDLTVHKMAVLDASGDPVPLLADGTPSITAVPIGPHYFGDIGPCSCVSRQFTIHSRGAKAGEYKVELDGICFNVCLHQDTKACFIFEVCKD